MRKTPRAVGIDLGTYFTVLACIDESGRSRVIPNAEGQVCTPSVVAFTLGTRVLAGQAARLQASANPLGTISSIKRRMGSDEKVRAGGREYTPQEVSSLILRKVKADAEHYLGEKIEEAVITVPAYFNDRQRQATREAGLLAGLSAVRIVNEPTAAALAYGLDREDVQTVMVWDLGAGTFDVSILALGEGIFEVRAVSGDTQLGGDDFTQRVVDYLALRYQEDCGTPIPEDPHIWERLRQEAEKVKIRLCSSPVARVNLPFLVSAPEGPRHLETELSRDQFDGLTVDLAERLVIPTLQALRDADLTPEGIERVILVGGGCLLPRVRALARQLLGKEPYRYIDPFTVVAQGAAIYAGTLLGLVDKVVLLDVLPLSLGVEVQGGLTAKIIPRNTPLPASEARVFTTAADYQTCMDIQVLQGERALASENVSLGQFQLSGIPSAPRGMLKVEVAFEADVDGIVHVSAKELLTENTVVVRVASTKLLTPEEIESLREEAEGNAEQDKDRQEKTMVGIEADNTIAAAEQFLEAMVSYLSDLDVQAILNAVEKVKQGLGGATVDDARGRCQELRQLLGAIHSKMTVDAPSY